MPRSSTSVMKASRSAARERAMRGSRSAAAVVAGAEAGATTAEAAGVGAAAGAGVAAVLGVATWSYSGAAGAACATGASMAVFDAVKCPPWVQLSGLLNRLIIIQHLVQ